MELLLLDEKDELLSETKNLTKGQMDEIVSMFRLDVSCQNEDHKMNIRTCFSIVFDFYFHRGTVTMISFL